MSWKYQKHAKQQEWRIRHLKKELKKAREAISRLKAVNVSSSVKEQRNLKNWIILKTSKSRCCRFSADDVRLVRLSNRFSVLETGTLDVGQKSPFCCSMITRK
jgi:hypothetical protein